MDLSMKINIQHLLKVVLKKTLRTKLDTLIKYKTREKTYKLNKNSNCLTICYLLLV